MRIKAMEMSTLEMDNCCEDVDIKHEPLEPGVDNQVCTTGYFIYNLRTPQRNLLMTAIH